MTVPESDSLRHWIGTLWPIALVAGGALLVFGQQANQLDSINNSVQALQTEVRSRLAALDASGHQRDQRLYALERDTEIFKERTSGIVRDMNAMAVRMGEVRAANAKEHDEIVKALQALAGQPIIRHPPR